MKVLYIPSWYPTKQNPLSGSFFLEQIKLLEDFCDVEVLYPRMVGLRDYFFDNKNDEVISPPSATQTKYLRIPKFPSFLGYASVENSFKKIIKSYVPDIIHAHSVIWGGYFAVKLGRKYKIKTIVTEHTVPYQLEQFTEYQRKKIKWTIENATIASSVSSYGIRCMAIVAPNLYPKVVGNFVDERLFTISPKENDTFKILTVGGKEWKKDLFTFLESLKILSKKTSDFLATIVCLNKYSVSDVISYLENHQLMSKCNILTQVERNRMPELYQSHDVFVSTSITESFGISMVEAMMCGKPVISTRNGGAEDFVTEENGVLVPIRNALAISENLLNIKLSKKKFKPEQIRNSVLGRFGSVAFSKKHLELYNDALKRV